MGDNNSVILPWPKPHMVFNVANNSTFRDRSKGQNIANDEVGLLATVEKLAGVNSLGGDEEFLLVLVSKRVLESDTNQWDAMPRVVDYLCHNILNVPIALVEVKGAEAAWALTVVGVGLENRARSLMMCHDYTTHSSVCFLRVPTDGEEKEEEMAAEVYAEVPCSRPAKVLKDEAEVLRGEEVATSASLGRRVYAEILVFTTCRVSERLG
ncbi:Hypothetical predicted protein [Olea europaea subsp. europaea]|uniref:Uncharacterized protein n=1 Tax=Olea europaea subsp. europaea TaxID=158383 RepID=A0A8S0SE77_OLEEU|nr:Hypothetical predicted protein [Olea europaea subsp. europaea]